MNQDIINNSTSHIENNAHIMQINQFWESVQETLHNTNHEEWDSIMSEYINDIADNIEENNRDASNNDLFYNVNWENELFFSHFIDQIEEGRTHYEDAITLANLVNISPIHSDDNHNNIRNINDNPDLNDSENNSKYDLKNIKYYKNKYNQTQCPITLRNFEEEDHIIELPCNHIFDTQAIIQWVCTPKFTCPVCRHPLQL
uniref:RING-type E3 ubiquitin transferase n=1 Tax=viral metagenome TaxID=1070528 RepID=A0A6C0KHG6_9ZZZZ